MPAITGMKMRAGSIKRVKLTNFMCHAELSVDFGCQVSFVTGHNGSGKSAILAGIVAGLGARANTTSRGGKLSDLIKHGERSATVVVDLNNQGRDPEPYLPDIYGSSISIERTFHMDKSGSYCIKSASGKIVSKKRQDLDNILDHFGIQVNNPVFLMNQDTCRSFLNSKTGKELYSFFYKAPLLDEMEIIVGNTRLQAEEAAVVVNQKEEEMSPVNEAIETWREKQSKCVRPETIQKDIDNCETDIKIHGCHELKFSLEKLKKAVAVSEDKRNDHINHVRKCEEKIPIFQGRLVDERTREENLRLAMEESQKALDDSKPEMAKVREAAQAAQRTLTDSTNEVKEKQRNLASLESQLESVRNQQDLREYDQRKIQLETQMEETNTAMQACRIDRAAAETDKRRFEEELSDCRRRFEPMNNSWQAIQRIIEDLDREIRQYQGTQPGGSSAVARLGKDAVARKTIIDGLVQRKALKGQILGPCVDFIGLKDQPYGIAVERAVGPWLRTYLLEDESDRTTILDEFRRQKMAPPALDCALGTGKKFPTADHPFLDKCNSPFPTVLDLLNFKHPYVRSVLVDALNLHQIAVLPTLDQARKHYREERPFENCRHILDLTANQHSKDGDGYQFIPSYNRGVCVLAADFEAQISEKMGEKNDKVAVRDAQKVEKERLEAQMRDLQQKISGKSRDIIKFQDIGTKAQNRFNSLKNELESIKTCQPTDIQVLLDEVDELKAVLEKLLEQVAEHKEAHTKAKAREVKADERFKIMKQQSADELKEAGEVETSIARLEQSIAAKETELQSANKTTATLEKAVEARKAEVDVARTAFETSKAAMLESGVPMERLRLKVKRTVAELEETILKLQAQMRYITADYENSWEFCQKKLDELQLTKSQIGEQIVAAKNVVTLMGKNARIRADNYKTARDKASAMLCSVFKATLEERGYDGHIDLDHEGKVLTFQVNPHRETQQEETSVKSLSGGERSFTMVCFLVALWTLIEIPFRVLDEFDVFMDMVNRDFAMSRLINAAIESGRQFIFLTPLHFSQSILDDFKTSNSVEVIRMPTLRNRLLPTAASDE